MGYCERNRIGFIFELTTFRRTETLGYAEDFYVPPPKEEDAGIVGGGGDEFETDQLVICWYYRYADGSRSAYYRCDPV